MKTLLKISLFALLSGAVFAADGSAVRVADGHVRALPPTVPNTAAYLTLVNGGEEDLALTGASSPAAASASLHETSAQEGRMMMRPVESAALPAGGELRLEAGGLHVMLMGLRAPLSPGDEVELTLRFDDGSALTVSLPVRSAAAAGDHQH